MLTWVVAWLGLAAVTCDAHAALQPGQVGLYFDRLASVTALDGWMLTWSNDELGRYVDLPVYLLAQDLPDGLRRAEFGLGFSRELVKVLSVTSPEGTTVEQSTSQDLGTVSFTIDAGSGCVDSAGLVVMAEFLVRFREYFNVQVWLRDAIPSSLEPPAPGYVDCSTSAVTTWHPFDVGGYGVEVSIPDPVGESAWGAVKAAYAARP